MSTLAWVVIVLGVGSLVASGLLWAVGRVAGRDDRRLERTKPRKPERPAEPERRELRKTDRL